MGLRMVVVRPGREFMKRIDGHVYTIRYIHLPGVKVYWRGKNFRIRSKTTENCSYWRVSKDGRAINSFLTQRNARMYLREIIDNVR